MIAVQVDSSTIIAGVAVLSFAGGVLGWVARHMVRDFSGPDRSPQRDFTQQPGPWPELEAALARHEVSLIDRFNGRYPSKDIFLGEIRAVKDQIVEVRKYIGDVEERLGHRLDSLQAADKSKHASAGD